MEVISNVANGFIGLFQAGGETFMGWVTGIIPLVICLMTAVNAVIGFIGVQTILPEHHIQWFLNQLLQEIILPE